MSAIQMPLSQPLWLPHQQVVSRYKYTCPKCGREHGKRSPFALWRDRLRLAMGASGEVDIDFGDDVGNFRLNGAGALQICGDCCACSLSITFSGVDAAMCTTCEGFTTMVSMSLDGTYVLNLTTTEEISSVLWCIYTLDNASMGRTRDSWANSNCTGAKTTNSATDGDLFVAYRPDTGELAGGGAGPLGPPTRNLTVSYNIAGSRNLGFFRDATGDFLGDTLPNDLDCTSSNHASSGGTAVVTAL